MKTFDGQTVDIEVDGVGVIIECQTGITFRRDAAGIYQLAMSAEGVFVPLEAESEKSVREALREVFAGKIVASLDETLAARIDAILQKHPRFSLFTVDRTRLEVSPSSWVWVKWDAVELDELAFVPFGGFTSTRGALIWPNYE